MLFRLKQLKKLMLILSSQEERIYKFIARSKEVDVMEKMIKERNRESVNVINTMTGAGFKHQDEADEEVDESLPDKETTKDVRFRIGAAKHISCPSNFDDIDYGTSELFGL